MAKMGFPQREISPFFNDWRWQIKNSIKTLDELKQKLPAFNQIDSLIPEGLRLPSLPFSVTPYFISLMTGEENCPILLQVIPANQELLHDAIEMRDPLGEEERQKVAHLVHRYPDRVLFLATDRCASYCRFCTRKRWVGQGPSPSRDDQEKAFLYIENNKQIKEIIFSGGDPLLLSNERIYELISRAFSISHIDMVRFHSRMLSFAPMRIDQELCQILQKFSPIYLVTHFNHPKEITNLAIKAIDLLNKSGVVLLNQSVLLKDINDDEKILENLFRTLVKNKIRPFYLHQCDVVTGAKHFRVSIAHSIELMEKLRGHISGLCLPTLVIDIPGGHGKVPLSKSPIVNEDEQFIYLRGFAGGIAAYPKE
jgi:lysine 2,3-aminomutase